MTVENVATTLSVVDLWVNSHPVNIFKHLTFSFPCYFWTMVKFLWRLAITRSISLIPCFHNKSWVYISVSSHHLSTSPPAPPPHLPPPSMNSIVSLLCRFEKLRKADIPQWILAEGIKREYEDTTRKVQKAWKAVKRNWGPGITALFTFLKITMPRLQLVKRCLGLIPGWP